MREITAKQAARAAGGRVIFGDPEKKICHISLDSRKMEGRDLFVPIVGERVDAHRFICQAISAGAETVFTSCHHSEKEVREAIESQCREHPEWSGQALLSTWICVEDTKAALQALGAWCRSQAQIPLVGITGSVGKTTTREMVACALSAGYRVYKTPGNSNSQVGVPITVFNIPKEAQIGVIELGMSEPGEMTKIAQVAQTDCAVMTNIGVAHIEQLGSKENILKEKLHIQDGMAEEEFPDEAPGQFQGGIAVYIHDFSGLLHHFESHIEHPVDLGDGIVHIGPCFSGNVKGPFVHIPMLLWCDCEDAARSVQHPVSRPQKRGCCSYNSPFHYTNYAIIFKTYPQSSPAKFPMAAPRTPIRTPMPA